MFGLKDRGETLIFMSRHFDETVETLWFPERKRKRKREFYWKSANHYQLEQYSTPWIAEFHVHFYVDTNHLIDIPYCFK